MTRLDDINERQQQQPGGSQLPDESQYLVRQQMHRVIDGWTLAFQVTPANRRAVEAMTTLSDGVFGRRGLPLGPDHPPSALVLASGVFDDAEVPGLLDAPQAAIAFGSGRADNEPAVILDLRRGLVTSDATVGGHEVSIQHFASSVRNGIDVLRIAGPAEIAAALSPLAAPSGSGRSASARGAIAAAARRTTTESGNRLAVTRITALASSPPDDDPTRIAATQLGAASAATFEQLQREHESEWLERWSAAAIDLPDRPDIEARLRFAQFHLLSLSGIGAESAIGARAATGHAYNGHVFWDTDVFVVPALSAMDPRRARAALEYRHRRLGAAKDRAGREGRSGARFPWESADTGAEVAPTEGIDLHGQTIEIKTGTQEEHIVADVAWSVMHHLWWTDDDVFARGPASEILLETARYWHSRVDIDSDGSAHIRRIIGPDEYHESVDDNMFTNVMARWNLRRAADHCESHGSVDADEANAWRSTADRLVDGYDSQTGVHEQFDGFFDLDPIMVAGIGTPPLPADALLGHERVNQSQIIKQPDVLMAHHLVPDEMPAGSFEADLDVYLPRTAHGSSLSPAITAALLARAGRLDEAEHWFDIALRLDLDDISRTTAGGLHVATLGGVWQAFVFGFMGVRPDARALHLDPRVPQAWGTVSLRCSYRSVPVRLSASSDHVTLICPDPIDVILPGGQHVTARRLTALRHVDDWIVQ